jgi:hypothetical protein
MALYQRALDPKRAPELTQFLKSDAMNIVPGAIIIATTPGALRTTPAVTPADTSEPHSCSVTISALQQTTESALHSALKLLHSRFSEPENDVVEQLEQSDDEHAELVELEESIEDDESDAGIPSSYLTSVAADLNALRMTGILWMTLNEQL